MAITVQKVLNTLNVFDELKNQSNLNDLDSSVSTYVASLSKLTINQNTTDKHEEIDEYLYGKIVKRLALIIDNSATIDERVLLIMNKLIVMDSMPFPIFYELLTITDDILKKITKPATINMLITILKEVVKSNALYFVLINVCANHEQNSVRSTSFHEKWKNFIQLIVSLPSKLANKTNGFLDDSLTLNNYSKIIIYHTSRALLFLNDNYKQFNTEPELNLISSMISKCMLVLGSSRFADLIYIFQNWALSNHHTNIQSMVHKVLYNMERNSIEASAVLFFKLIEHPGDVRKIFGEILSNPQWKYVLTKKIPLISYYNNDNLIINLISYLSSAQEQEILHNLVIQLLKIWGNKSALSHTSIDQHEYITKLILASIKQLKSSLKLADINNIRKLLFDGTSFHLTSLQIEVRAIGMITSELIIQYLNSDGSPELKFDYDSMPDAGKDIIIRLQRFSDITVESVRKNDSDFTNNTLFDAAEQRIHKLGVKCCISTQISSEDNTINNNCNNDLLLQKETILKEVENENNEVNDTVKYDSDIDSDDDLIPYDTSNDQKTAEKLKPTYLRDLKDNIINSSANNRDPDVFSESMQAAEDLILSQLPNDDASFAIELLNIFMTLRNEVYVENFETLKFRICVAIVTVYPKQCANFLCQEFHSESREVSVSDRCFFLEVLGSAAKELSRIKINNDEINPIEPVKTKAKKPTGPLSLVFDVQSGKRHETLYDEEFEVISENNNDDDWREIIDKRVQLNTRRFAHETKSANMTVNRFNDVASSFFYPLIHGMSLKNTYLYTIPQSFVDQENILLVNYLKTLSVIMIAAENCVIAPKMALAILELAWSLRYHEEASIRLAVIKNVASTIVSLSKHNFTVEILELLIEFKAWLDDVSINSVKGDPDSNCRKIGRDVLALIDTVVKPLIKPY